MSRTNYQFPPSSPFNDNDSGNGDDRECSPAVRVKETFAISALASVTSQQQKLARGYQEYPTPNPSSSLFRSSSPVKAEFSKSEKEPLALDNLVRKNDTNTNTNTDNDKEKEKVQINKDFNIVNSDKNVVRIPFSTDEGHFTIGRSSRNCDFPLDSKDARISRVHLKLSYDAKNATITCVGANGVGIVIPRPCYILATEVADQYLITENKSGNPLDTSNLKSLTIEVDDNHTEFNIHKGETVIVPRFENIVLEISKQVIILNPCYIEEFLTEEDDELTDDEELMLLEGKAGQDHEDASVTPVNRMLSSSLPNTPSKPKAATTDITGSREDDYETPSKEYVVKIANPKSVNATTFTVYQDQDQSQDTAARPTSSSTTTTPMGSVFTDIINNRRAVSEEPKSQKRAYDTIQDEHEDDEGDKENFAPATSLLANPAHENVEKKNSNKNRNKNKRIRPSTPIFDDSALSLPDISEIKNILINHLAFSRSSSTPASVLNTISASTSPLSLSQIRGVLNSIKCVGVIYRQGKDAAGKPLEEEYYYMPEHDEDQGRTQLMSNVKGHTGLRSCRRTHKQYYWKKPAPVKKT
ncbi:uncharacterized protein LODBEIA_P02100 [Lodderomyces beijingensis]|uniref:FHA domain-containing protein n=1 Tax=Lodderomyces beijingensis TaxID=1775926 RepID=A0ABP0ZGL6_9ASCO